MTSEDAREWLRSIKDNYIHGGDDAFDNARRESLDMAIKALDQTDKIEESNFSTEQYKADLQSAYECGYQHGYADALNDECESEE